MRWLVLGMIFILYLVNYADKAILGLAAEPIMKELHLNFEQFGAVGSSFYFTYAIGSILLASLTYRFKTKFLLIVIALGWTVSLTSAYFVHSVTGLIIIRVMLGFFEGGTYGLAITHLAKWFAAGTRGTVYAIMGSGVIFGSYLTAPVLVPFILSYGWRHSFALLGVLSLVWAIVFLFFREQPKKPLEINSSSPEAKSDAKFKDIGKIIFNPFVLSVFFASFISMWINAWVAVWAPTYLTKIVGLEPKVMGLAFAGIGITAAIISIIVGKVTDSSFKKTNNLNKSYVKSIVTALAIGAIGFGLTTMVQAPVMAIIFLTIGLSMNNCIVPFCSSIYTSIAPHKLVGTISGIALAISSVAGIISPIFTGYLVGIAGKNLRAGFNNGVWAVVVIYVLGAIFLVIAGMRKKKIEGNVTQLVNEEPIRS
ncbi:MFS transporter [Bacillus sp. X1(2014)]|uniref:MFS transporter n=1 Tax=Bacillus sp. X1(2014) TaxID=1565991 RepID=UPI0011A842AE|nr:MFS transporter [Bacillus sp. X1(2014)]